MLNRIVTIVSVLIALVSLTLWAVGKSDGHMPGKNHGAAVKTHGLPREGGQSTFAALIEIVDLLERDPKTNWAKVNIGSLHEHLLDMNHLMLATQATTSVLSDSRIQFTVRGTADSIPSIHRMVPAHSRFIGQSRGWEIQHELTDTGATLTITVEETDLLDRLNALGFYGFMSMDSHHQAHHYQMAIGNSH